MPATVVTAEGWSPFKESELIGEYGQPRWTSRRLFPTTRVYVLRPGQFDFELWHRIKVPEKGPSTVETQYEVEFGLPGRFQFDYYLVTEREGSDEGTTDFSETKYELRYALALREVVHGAQRAVPWVRERLVRLDRDMDAVVGHRPLTCAGRERKTSAQGPGFLVRG